MGSSERCRPSSRRWILVVLAVLTAGFGAPIDESGHDDRADAMPAAKTSDTGPAGVLPADGRWTVTLLTGEVVDVQSDADGRVMALVREQTTPVRTVQVPSGDLYVIPMAVTSMLDRLVDRELFNVTGLIQQGYDDAASGVIPLIVQGGPGADAEATVFGATERLLPSIGAVAVDLPKASTMATAGELLTNLDAGADPGADVLGGVSRVWLDRRVTAFSAPPTPRSPVESSPSQRRPRLDENLAQIGADDAWAAGLTGEGVRVAVLDTGVDAQHPDLTGQIVAQENFSDSGDTVDRDGHGTHVASLVAGTGAASAGARSGVAPEADLLIGKVLGDNGFGEASDLIAGMEWAAPQADIVNMSLGADLPTDGSDPVSTALDRLTEQHGTLFVVAAGNSGPFSQTVGIPAAADRALAVGAVDSQDQLAEFSSRSPLVGSFELKPEVVAPGVDIVAARAVGTAHGEPVDGTYITNSGTSMAAPHVAGAAAVLAQQHRDWTGDQLRHALIGSTAPIDADGFDAGTGRIDIGAGITTLVHADRDVVDMPLVHPRTQPHIETLTWTNTGSQPQTLTLSADLEDREGDDVGEVSVEPTEITIPAGAAGSATLGVDGPDLASGLYSGTVTALSLDGHSARVPIAVHAAAEMVDLTIEATAPGGATATEPFVSFDVVNLDDFAEFNLSSGFSGDVVTIQVPKGRYAVIGAVANTDPDNLAVAQVGDPDVTITDDTTVTFDGAAAVPLSPRVEGVETAAPTHSMANLRVTPRAGTGGHGLTSGIQSQYPMPPVHVTPMEGDPGQFAASQLFRLQAPHITAEAAGTLLDIVTVPGAADLPEGEHTLAAVDVADGTDLSSARDQLAIVELPADDTQRRAIGERAADAGVAVLVFVDEQRPRLTLGSFGDGFVWARLPIVAVAGTSATSLRATAATGSVVTVAVAPSPYVYDIVTPDANHVDPDPVITRTDQAELATLDEHFHRDPDGKGSAGDVRIPISVFPMQFNSQGPLPELRTAHVSPDVTWQSGVRGPALEDWGSGPEPTRTTWLSLDAGSSYTSGSHHSLTWLRRPQWPAPGGGRTSGFFCTFPVTRSADQLHVFLSAFQDGPDRESCSRPIDATLTLERDGAQIGTAEGIQASFPVPADHGTYRLGYDQEGQAPYTHRSSTWWTFGSSAPDDQAGEEAPIPLLTVEYQLPLDTLNRPIGDTATLRVQQGTGTDRERYRSTPAVWTSSDDGATWQPARVHRAEADSFEVRLPDVPSGTGVSLRVDASGARGSRIEQTLFDAYTS